MAQLSSARSAKEKRRVSAYTVVKFNPDPPRTIGTVVFVVASSV